MSEPKWDDIACALMVATCNENIKARWRVAMGLTKEEQAMFITLINKAHDNEARIRELKEIHGHGDKTVVCLIDEHDPQHKLDCSIIAI